jgi:phosphoglucosamine mutase
MQKCPQVLINVPVKGAAAELLTQRGVRDAVTAVEKQLGGDGRVLLRPSGTEPLVRVMVEGADESTVRRCAEQIAASVRASI